LVRRVFSPRVIFVPHAYLWHSLCLFFFFNDPATPELYTLSLHDALPISSCATPSFTAGAACATSGYRKTGWARSAAARTAASRRSEEHTSELQSLTNLVCRLLLEKKNKTAKAITH